MSHHKFYSCYPHLTLWDYANSSTKDLKYLTSTCYLWSMMDERKNKREFNQQVCVWLYKDPAMAGKLPTPPIPSMLNRFRFDKKAMQVLQTSESGREITSAAEIITFTSEYLGIDATPEKPTVEDPSHIATFIQLQRTIEKCAMELRKFETFKRVVTKELPGGEGLDDDQVDSLYRKFAKNTHQVDIRFDMPRIDFVEEYYVKVAKVLQANPGLYFATASIKLNLGKPVIDQVLAGLETISPEELQKMKETGVMEISAKGDDEDFRNIELAALELPGSGEWVPSPDFATQKDLLQYIDNNCTTITAHTPIIF